VAEDLPPRSLAKHFAGPLERGLHLHSASHNFVSLTGVAQHDAAMLHIVSHGN
jgi:hypothetical protein